MKSWRRKSKLVLILLSHLRLQKLGPQSVISASKRWRRHLTVGGDMNRKRVWTDGYVLCQKTLRPYKAFRKGTPETSDSKPFTAGERWLPRFRRRSGVSWSHIVTRRRVSKIRYLRERPQSYNFYYSVLLQLFYFIIVVNLLLCLIDKLNFILDVHVEVMCVCVSVCVCVVYILSVVSGVHWGHLSMQVLVRGTLAT